jgi:hypothetical protein
MGERLRQRKQGVCDQEDERGARETRTQKRARSFPDSVSEYVNALKHMERGRLARTEVSS